MIENGKVVISCMVDGKQVNITRSFNYGGEFDGVAQHEFDRYLIDMRKELVRHTEKLDEMDLMS